MNLVVLLAFSLQADPEILAVERLTGDVHRPYLWTPLLVDVKSAGGFEGDLVVTTSFGFTVRRRIRLAPGGKDRFLVPALDPEKVAAGTSEADVPRVRGRARWLVGVDERLPFAADLAATKDLVVSRLRAADLDRLRRGSMGEAFDLLLLSEGKGAGPHVRVVATREEAERELAALSERPERERIPAVDRSLWKLQPEAGWSPAKRNFAVFFVTLYAFLGFAALAGVVRKRPRWAPGAMAGAAVLGLAAYLLFFPSGHLWVVASACEVSEGEEAAEEWRAWFVGSEAELTTELEFTRLVKPVLQNPFTEPFSIRVLEGGCRVEELRLPAGGTACFAGLEVRAPSLTLAGALSAPLYRARIRRDGGDRTLGDLARGATIPEGGGAEGGVPPDPDLLSFGRFLSGPCLYGWLEPGEGSTTDAVSPDLDVAPRLRPRLFVRRAP